ncbi:nebulette isoform X3 [Pogoniulus pusillus]|uniref:nebulette isoform X3 n=1 Tax=Pogoniulus pusillus TaxID=488313 RepID=UPI0030B924D7
MRVPAQDLRENGEEEEEEVFLKPVLEDRNMELARKCSELISDIPYKEEFKKSKGKCISVADTPQLKHAKSLAALLSEVKYKGAAKKDLSNSLYQQMPATIDSVFAKGLTQLQSKVLYTQKHAAEKGTSDYAHMKEPPDIKHAMEVNKHQSDVSYKKDVEETHRYTEVLNRPDIRIATEITKLISDAEYKKGRREMTKEPVVLGRPDFEHAKGVSKLLSQVKYKEQFSKEMKSHQYNPLDSASFKQAQLAATLASDVNYRKDLESLHDPASDLPNLLYLNHALNISKTQSDVKYKENYEKSKGRSMLEFVETPMYQVSKEAQKMQSEKMYRRDFEEGIKGRPSMDLDKTPGFLHLKEVTNLLKEKEYRKDLEEGVKGKGMTVFEDTPDLIRVKNAAQILNEKQYRKDLETEIKGKGMQVGPDTPEIRRAKKASEIASTKEYKKDLENEIKGKGMEVSVDTLDIQRAKKASEIVSQKEYKKDLETEIIGKGMQVGPYTPEIQRVKRASEIASQVFYKKEVGAGTAVRETPEMERVRKNQQNISSIKYKEEIQQATTISDPPELRRVKENQKNISNVQYKEQLCKATPMSITPEIERVKRNQENVSMVHYREQLGKATAVSSTPEMERVKKNQDNISSVKYSSDQRQMKGRRSVLLDTPELRHVRETQNNISMVKYHEDFEKTRGRGFTPVVDDPITERVRKNTQIVSDAAYKGVHPHIVEMDRRPGIIVDLKVWRTDPGSIFDIDPLEDNIQSRSLHMLSERASRYSKQYLHSTSLGDYKSDGSDTNPTFSYCSEVTRPSDEAAPVLPGAYQQSQSQGYGYMHQTSMSSMRSMHSQPHSASLRTYRAMYDYSAQDEDEVSFRDGDYIINVQPIDDGWMYGTVQRTGKTGMLPANYIEFVN